MRYFASVFLCRLFQQLRSVKCWLVLLLIPTLILGAGRLTGESASAPVTVGVVLPESGGEELWSLLSQRSDGILSFVPAQAEEVDRNVAAGKWDCGLIFPSDFWDRLEEEELDRSILLRIGPGSAAYPLVQETVSACICRLISPVIAREYLRDAGIVYAEQELENRQEAVLAETPRVGITLTTTDGAVLRVPELTRHGVDQLLFWLISAMILARMLFHAVDLAKILESAGVKRLLPLRSGFSTLTAQAAADAALLAISGCTAASLLGGGLWGCMAVLGYILFWMFFSVLLARFPRCHDILPVCLPFSIPVSLLLSAALVDPALLFPALSLPSRWMPCGLFLRICKGELSSLLILFGESVLVALLALCLHGGRPSCHRSSNSRKRRRESGKNNCLL